VGAIHLPLVEDHVAFYVTNTMMELLQVKGIFGGLDHENPHEHIRNFVGTCNPFSFKDISQESIWLWLFPFSLMGEATKWLAELPRDSIISWEELTEAFYVRLFPRSKMVNMRITSKTSGR